MNEAPCFIKMYCVFAKKKKRRNKILHHTNSKIINHKWCHGGHSVASLNLITLHFHLVQDLSNTCANVFNVILNSDLFLRWVERHKPGHDATQIRGKEINNGRENLPGNRPKKTRRKDEEERRWRRISGGRERRVM